MLGAGLFAANLSTTFRLRKFGMADGATYPVQYQARPRPATATRDCSMPLLPTGQAKRNASTGCLRKHAL